MVKSPCFILKNRNSDSLMISVLKFSHNKSLHFVNIHFGVCLILQKPLGYQYHTIHIVHNCVTILPTSNYVSAGLVNFLVSTF